MRKLLLVFLFSTLCYGDITHRRFSDRYDRTDRLSDGSTAVASTCASCLTGLVSYYKLDGDAIDSHGSNDGTATSVTYAAAKISQGAESPLLASTIAITLTNATTFSVSFWIKPYVNPNHQGGRTEYGQLVGQDSNNSLFLHQAGAGALSLQLWVAGALKSDTVIAEGEWRFVVMTADSSTVKIYVNASEVYSGASAPSWAIDTLFLQAATLMDEIAIWHSHVLTPTEVTTLYGAGAGLAYSTW